MEMYIDIDPLNYYASKVSSDEVGATLMGIPGLLYKAYATPKKTPQTSFREVLSETYGYSLKTIRKAKIKNKILTYPQDPDSYPLVNFILAGGIYDTLTVLQYQNGIIHVSGSETFTTRMD